VSQGYGWTSDGVVIDALQRFEDKREIDALDALADPE
jgi:hypothetical protein